VNAGEMEATRVSAAIAKGARRSAAQPGRRGRVEADQAPGGWASNSRAACGRRRQRWASISASVGGGGAGTGPAAQTSAKTRINASARNWNVIQTTGTMGSFPKIPHRPAVSGTP